MSGDPYEPYEHLNVKDESHSNRMIVIDNSKMWIPMVLCFGICVAAYMTAQSAKEEAHDTGTKELLLRSHVDELRNTLERHGIPAPQLPKELNQ